MGGLFAPKAGRRRQRQGRKDGRGGPHGHPKDAGRTEVGFIYAFRGFLFVYKCYRLRDKPLIGLANLFSCKCTSSEILAFRVNWKKKKTPKASKPQNDTNDLEKENREAEKRILKLPEAHFTVIDDYNIGDAPPMPDSYYRFIEKPAEEQVIFLLTSTFYISES